VDYKNVDPCIAAIIDHGKADLIQLKTSLTVEDAMNLWEIIAISSYNQWLATKHAEKKAKEKNGCQF